MVTRLQSLINGLKTKGVYEPDTSSYYKKEKQLLEDKLAKLKQAIKA